MSHWVETPKGHFEMENGILTGKCHNVTYHEAHGHVVKVIHNSDGTSKAEVLEPRKTVFINEITGDILAVNIGFSLQRELTGKIQIETVDGHTPKEVQELPLDFKMDTYKWDLKKNMLVKK